jgi:HAD superfamily hydrolase (TIGR01509 family)
MSIPEGFINAVGLAPTLAKYVNKKIARPGADEIDTVILDMDGTLLDLHFDQEVWNRVLPRRFASASGCSVESAKAEVAARLDSAKGTLDWYCLDYWEDILGIDLAALEIEHAHLVRPRPGAIEFLERLAKSPHRVVLATNAQPSSMQRKFDITGIDRYFDGIRSSHHYGTCKEDPKFWPVFTADLAIDPSRSIFIDDSHAVLQAALQFGIAYVYGIRQPSSFGQEFSSTKFHCIGAFDELLGII